MKKPRESLCWRCAIVVLGKKSPCSWVGKCVPVDGWIAREEKLQGLSKKTYTVYSCPLFKEDKN